MKPDTDSIEPRDHRRFHRLDLRSSRRRGISGRAGEHGPAHAAGRDDRRAERPARRDHRRRTAARHRPLHQRIRHLHHGRHRRPPPRGRRRRGAGTLFPKRHHRLRALPRGRQTLSLRDPARVFPTAVRGIGPLAQSSGRSDELPRKWPSSRRTRTSTRSSR